MIPSPHTHCESFLTASTVESLVTKAKALDRKYFSYTDYGHMASAMKVYKAAKKADLKPILGMEIYFKDITGTKADRCKYFTTTIYAEDQKAFQELGRMASRTDMPTIKLHDEIHSLWSWDDLKNIATFNTNLVLGGPHCMVGKLLLAEEPEAGIGAFETLKSIFRERLRVAMLCEPWAKKWSQVVEVKYTDKSKDVLSTGDLITTNRARRIRPMDLVERKGHETVEAKYVGGMYYNVDKQIDTVTLHEGFLPLPCDVTLTVNQFLYKLAKESDTPILATDYAFYADRDDKKVQDMILEGKTRLHSKLEMKSQDDIVRYLAKYLSLGRDGIIEILENNEKWAHLFDNFELKYDWRLADYGKDTLKQTMEIVKNNGRMKWSDPIWTARLKEELDVIAKNPKMDMTSYFLPIHDVMEHYKQNGRLTGPGRGSAAGSLLSYLMGITQVDPFKYDLSFTRFYSLDRIMSNRLADIDSDLESRDLLVGEDGKSGYLYSRWKDCVAQISTRATIRLKSAIKDTNRYLNGSVEPEIELLTEGLPPAPQGVSDQDFLFGFEDDDGNHQLGLIDQSSDLRNYIKNRPKEWEIVSKSLGITRAYSKHACAFIIADKPITDIIPTKEGYITQYEAKDVEAAGLVKLDFLVVSQLKDIRIALDLIARKNGKKENTGYFTHKDKETFIWDLPEDIDVFQSIWDGATETCFQISTASMTPFVIDILPKSIEDLGIISALDRPGPLDFIDPKTGRNMAQEYVYRRNGNSYEDISALNDLIPETYSVLVYQEQITKIAKELAGFSGLEAEQLREAIGKKQAANVAKMRPRFLAGAVGSGKVTQAEAEEIWERIATAGRYSFNKSHAISYAYITYACMFLKYHYPLEWWAAILTNAKETEISGEFWRYVKDLVLPPDINLSGDTMVIDYENEKLRSKLGVIRGLGEKLTTPLLEGRPYKDIQDFANKEVAGPSLAHKLIHVGVLDSLFPAKMSLIEKLKMYEDCVQKHVYAEKLRLSKETGKLVRMLKPNEGKIPEHYLNLHPMKDAAMKKAVLPSMPLDLHSLGKRYSKILAPYSAIPMVTNSRGYKTPLVDGLTLKRLIDLPGERVTEDKYVAATCFVVEAKEFSYSKGSKRALKLILDSDNMVFESVLWPEYESGDLVYPNELTKGAICTFFIRKRAGKKDINIQNVIVETC